MLNVYFIQYFYEGLRPSIKCWIDKQKKKHDNWDKLIEKAVWTKAKTGL